MGRPTGGRRRWIDRLLDPSATIIHALQATLAARVANRPRGVVIGLGIALLIAIVIVTPRRLDQRSRLLRGLSLLVIALISLANIASGTRLVIDLVNEEGIRDAERLLLTGGSIWLTNVIV